jgi:hypothetical protein
MSNDLIEFLDIKNKFILFLNSKNYLYKYFQNCIKIINDPISESIEKQIQEQLINYILFIRKEGITSCDYNTRDSLKLHYNTGIEIITESQKLLKKMKYSAD